MWISLTIMVIIEILLIVFAVFFITQFFNILFRGFAPYVSTRIDVINKIIDQIDLKDGEKVYELGCGKAGFLRAFEQKNPRGVFIGYEYSFWPYFVAKLQLSMVDSNIKIYKKNIFKADLKDADLIYCYLNGPMMEKLEKKFSAECKPGTQVISYTFQMPNRQPTKVVEVKRGHKVYFYAL
jgi:hypothetical protein